MKKNVTTATLDRLSEVCDRVNAYLEKLNRKWGTCWAIILECEDTTTPAVFSLYLYNRSDLQDSDNFLDNKRGIPRAIKKLKLWDARFKRMERAIVLNHEIENNL